MDWPEMNQTALNIGIGSGGVGLLGMLLSRLWRVANSTVKENKRDQAETSLYETLRSQIESLNRELDSIKERHKKERTEQDDRISKLEDNVRKLNFKRREAQDIALEAYTKLLTLCTGRQEQDFDDIKTLLKNIIDG